MGSVANSDVCSTMLKGSDLVGLTLQTEAGFLSMCADIVTLALILRRVVRHRRRPSKRHWKLLKTPLDLYILSLIVSDLVQAIGSVLEMRWIHLQHVFCGSFCTAQGTIQLLGETSSAMTTMAISVHTFLKIAFRLKLKNMWVPRIVIAFIWLYVILFAGIAAGIHDSSSVDSRGRPDLFNVPTPYWCWVGGRFPRERIAGEYIWLWLGALSSIVLYLPLYFIVRGQILVDTSAKLGVRLRRRVNDMGHSGGVHHRILLYPVAYTTLVLPLSVARWILFKTGSEPSAAVYFTITLFELSGFVNVLLLFYTRGRINLLADDPDDEFIDSRLEPGSGPSSPRVGDARLSRIEMAVRQTRDAGTGMTEDSGEIDGEGAERDKEREDERERKVKYEFKPLHIEGGSLPD